MAHGNGSPKAFTVTPNANQIQSEPEYQAAKETRIDNAAKITFMYEYVRIDTSFG